MLAVTRRIVHCPTWRKLAPPRNQTVESQVKYLTDDVRITGMEEVIAPENLLTELPIDDAASQLIFANRRSIGEIMRGEDPRLLVIAGPCSIHDPASAMEYADRLAELAAELRDTLQVVMRGFSK